MLHSIRSASSRFNSELRFERGARTSTEIAIFDEFQGVVDRHQERGQESFAFDVGLAAVITLDAEAGQHIRRLFGDLQTKIKEIR